VQRLIPTVLGMLLATNSWASLTPELQQKLLNVQVVSEVDFESLTYEQFREHPMPIAICSFVEKIAVGEDTLIISHNFRDVHLLRVNVSSNMHDIEKFKKLVIQVARWWGIREMDVEIQRQDDWMLVELPYSDILRASSAAAGGADKIFWNVLREHLATRNVIIEQLCRDVPKWMLESYPYGITRLTVVE
jgi:hypothetical protein